MAALSDAMYLPQAYQMVGDVNKPLQMPVVDATPFQSGAPGAVRHGRGMAQCRVPEGVEQLNVWSSWRTGGSDRTPANYPCALEQGACPSSTGTYGTPACGKSLVLRENSVWGDVVGSADGSGYLTTNWLPPNVPAARLGFCWVSRRVVPVKPLPSTGDGASGNASGDASGYPKTLKPIDAAGQFHVDTKNGQVYLCDRAYEPGSVSQLFLDQRPLLHYWSGRPFLFRSEQTPFIYMVPNALYVKTGGDKYRVDVVPASEQHDGCGCGSCADCIGY